MFVDKVEELAESLKDVIRDGDVIVTMGAGHISAVSHELAGQLVAPCQRREPRDREHRPRIRHCESNGTSR